MLKLRQFLPLSPHRSVFLQAQYIISSQFEQVILSDSRAAEKDNRKQNLKFSNFLLSHKSALQSPFSFRIMESCASQGFFLPFSDFFKTYY